MTKRYEVTNEEWERIAPLLPPQDPGGKGRPPKDHRVMLNGMLWIDRSGAQWRNMPECYGKWQAVYARFRKWTNDGVFEAIHRTLSAEPDMENLGVDSTSVKVHQSANGGKKGRKKRL